MILHIETLKSWGGEQNKVLNEMTLLRELGCETILICNPRSEISKRAKDKNFRVIELEMSKKNYIKTIPFVKNILEKESVKIAISHASTDSWILVIAGKLASNKPLILRERHNLFPVKSWLSKLQHRRLFDGILYISDAVKEYMLQIGVKENRLYKMFDCVNVNHFINSKATLREEFSIPKSDIVLGVFTSLTEAKGVYEFFEVTKKVLKKYKNLTVVFGGNYQESIKKNIDSFFIENNFNLSKIIWTGFREESANIMKDFDIFLFPSHSEGLGTVIIEAMASSLPIIVFNKKPMNDLVINNKNGFTVDYMDIESLVKATQILIEDRDLRVKFGQNSFEIVRKKYDISILKNSLKSLVEKNGICK